MIGVATHRLALWWLHSHINLYSAPVTRLEMSLYMCRFVEDYKDEGGSMIYRYHFDLYINPPADTFYFPDKRVLKYFTRFWQIMRGNKIEGERVIRSLVIGNMEIKALGSIFGEMIYWKNATHAWSSKASHMLGNSLFNFWACFRN
jgi:hypothetical protein